jgi:hypothetical protein
VEKRAAEIRASTNTLELHGEGQIKDAFTRAKAYAEKEYTTKFGGKSAADEGKAKGGTDSTAQRNAIEGVFSRIKEAIPRVLNIAADVKQRGVGVLASGANVIDATGERARKERERREGFQTEFLSGGQDLHNRIQSAALGGDQRKEEKETAKNTAAAVFELKTGFAGLLGALKNAKTLAPGYQ